MNLRFKNIDFPKLSGKFFIQIMDFFFTRKKEVFYLVWMAILMITSCITKFTFTDIVLNELAPQDFGVTIRIKASFSNQAPRNSWLLSNRHLEDERQGWTWSHIVVLNKEPYKKSACKRFCDLIRKICCWNDHSMHLGLLGKVLNASFLSKLFKSGMQHKCCCIFTGCTEKIVDN